MKKILTPVAIFGLLFSVACKKENNHAKSNGDLSGQPGITILQKRASNTPFYLSNKEFNSKKVLSAKGKGIMGLAGIPDILDIRYYLGRSYNFTNNDFGSPDGVGFPVIDIERLLTDHPDYYSSLSLREAEAISFSFTSFDKYTELSNKTTTTTGGFSLNLGLFKFGAKHKYENVFSSSKVNETNRVFGELNAYIRDASYKILTTDNVKSKITEDYLRPDFIDELYNNPMGKLIENFGSYVITNFNSGGRATALFTGISTSNDDSATKARSMDNSISASYGFKKEGADGGSLNFGIGNINGSTIASSNRISDFVASVKTYGGEFGFGTFTIPKKIDDININLNSWASSLNDKSKSVLVEFNQGGLIPISDFILEENFKESIRRHIIGPTNQQSFIEPRIEIKTEAGGFLGVYLVTRFGDYIAIADNDIDNSYLTRDHDDFMRMANKYKESKKNFYKINIIANDDDVIVNDITNTKVAGFARLNGINELQMKKFRNPKNNITYLLFNGDVSYIDYTDGNKIKTTKRKLAYAIHDDFVLDTYGIRDWVNSMATTEISFDELRTYVIVGL
ncbi:hypothetical protein IM793_11075 [Pedobacter sp. MR2016-19]|uniref:MAC/perforin domain-containing protein n=1 Tax=Pedobacter sp. MR2016-19 TaxID=2780089 RepID=UPI001873E834|nr:MAC/perforin domain-containing protein [Pedobacter sp. MR2016-19]MBE5319702.1 hypothetical protein [Pedobacter sp. MR2016-19]